MSEAPSMWFAQDVAKYLGVRTGTVYDYRRQGFIPAPDFTLGRSFAWRPETIIEWQASRPRPGVGGRPRKREE